ncbi:hypothetical protein ACTXT7_013630 [Hymenolepis weldensis]
MRTTIDNSKERGVSNWFRGADYGDQRSSMVYSYTLHIRCTKSILLASLPLLLDYGNNFRDCWCYTTAALQVDGLIPYRNKLCLKKNKIQP